MFELALIVSGLLFVAAPGWESKLLGRLHPSHAARASVTLQSTGIVVIVGMLIVWSLPAVLDLLGATHIAEMCRRTLLLVAPGGSVGGLVAAILAIVATVNSVMVLARIRQQRLQLRVEPWMGDHRLEEGYELVFLPTDTPIGYAVPGRQPQIVLSSGIVSAVGSSLVNTVKDHEVAHLRWHHHRYLAVATLTDSLFGWLPGVRRGTEVVRVALERWADEDAAGTFATSRAELRAGLLAVAARDRTPRAGFSGIQTVAQRVLALSAPPPVTPRWQRALGRAVMVVSSVGALTALAWSGQLAVSVSLHLGVCLV